MGRNPQWAAYYAVVCGHWGSTLPSPCPRSIQAALGELLMTSHLLKFTLVQSVKVRVPEL